MAIFLPRIFTSKKTEEAKLFEKQTGFYLPFFTSGTSEPWLCE